MFIKSQKVHFCALEFLVVAFVVLGLLTVFCNDAQILIKSRRSPYRPSALPGRSLHPGESGFWQKRTSNAHYWSDCLSGSNPTWNRVLCPARSGLSCHRTCRGCCILCFECFSSCSVREVFFWLCVCDGAWLSNFGCYGDWVQPEPSDSIKLSFSTLTGFVILKWNWLKIFQSFGYVFFIFIMALKMSGSWINLQNVILETLPFWLLNFFDYFCFEVEIKAIFYDLLIERLGINKTWYLSIKYFEFLIA